MVHAGIPFRILDLIFWQTFMNIVQGLVKVYEKFVDTRLSTTTFFLYLSKIGTR